MWQFSGWSLIIFLFSSEDFPFLKAFKKNILCLLLIISITPIFLILLAFPLVFNSPIKYVFNVTFLKKFKAHTLAKSQTQLSDWTELNWTLASQAGIKIAGRNINNFRYTDDTILMAESEEELKSLLMKLKEESEKAGLKLNICKTKRMASGPIISWQMGKNGNSDRLYFLGLQNHCRWWPQPWN